VNKTGLNVTFEITSEGQSTTHFYDVAAGGGRSIADNFLGCADLSKVNFQVYGGSVVPAGKVIGTRDKEWCRGTWTIELLPAPAVK
jgi:hypothetical protein